MISRLLIPIVMQLLAIVIILAEFIIPSAGILTVIALSLFGYSLYLVFTTVSLTAGLLFVALDILLVPVLIIAGVKLLELSPVTLKTNLGKGGGDTDPESKPELLQAEGVTITDLHPAGTAIINGKRTDVVSKGEYLPKDTPIIVTSATGNRVVVRKRSS